MVANHTQIDHQEAGTLARLALRIPRDGRGTRRFGFADWDTARLHATGCRALFASNRGLLVGLSALKSREAWSELSVGEDYLKFHFRLEGDNQIQVLGGDSHAVRAGRFSIISHPAGVVKEERWSAEEVETSITLACKAPMLSEYFEQRASQLPHPLRDFLAARQTSFWWRAAPMSVDMYVAARSLVSSLLEGKLEQLQLEAQSLQLLYYGIKSLEERSERTLRLSDRDIRVIEHAAQILRQEFANPPRVGCLARMVGMNDAKLCVGFKQVFNMTISAYTRQLRMQKAKSLLETTGLSIIDVAMEVGYNHSSNFATAFKRHFGIAPKQARRSSH